MSINLISKENYSVQQENVPIYDLNKTILIEGYNTSSHCAHTDFTLSERRYTSSFLWPTTLQSINNISLAYGSAPKMTSKYIFCFK